MIDYIGEFPLPSDQIPNMLSDLLVPETLENPGKEVLVSARLEKNKYQEGYEYLHMLMACVPEQDAHKIDVFQECSNGLVAFSTPTCENKGGINPFTPSVSGYDYVVASWGDGSHNAYFLAEKVLMTLGLSPRVIGNSEQRVVYDDLSAPTIGVAEGDIASEYYWTQKGGIRWTMRNDYLRQYLWMTGCLGVRSFFYEGYLENSQEIGELLGAESHIHKKIGQWCDFDLRRHEGRLLLQVWASVVALEPVQCPAQDKFTLIWPGDNAPMTPQRVSNFLDREYAYLDDRFLERYEKDAKFEAVPFRHHGTFCSTPSYKGQWSYRDCTRVGRNLLRMSLYELYRGVPCREVYHAHRFALPEAHAMDRDFTEEHIVSKAYRLLEALIELGERLAMLVQAAGVNEAHASDFLRFSREEFEAEGIRNYPIIQKLAQVAPLDMYEQDFLGRCKTLNEIIVQMRLAPLRRLLRSLGADAADVRDLKALRLLQSIRNIIDHLNEEGEDKEALATSARHTDWKARNQACAPLFINNDLRNAESHESVEESVTELQRLGFDTASLSNGYGRALDFLLDGVINSISGLSAGIDELLER